jgi:exosortase
MKLPAPKYLLQIAILLTSFMTLFGHTIAEMIRDWSVNDNYSHGFLIPIIAAYMIWQKKEQLSQLCTKPSNIGLLVIIFGMCIFIIGKIGAELFITRTAIVITVIGLCIYFFGTRISMAVFVPLIYLMFMIPLPAIIWNKIAFPLQLLAAKLAMHCVQFIGIPLLREGNILHLPNTTLEVVDACSGLRSLTSLLALSAAFAYIANTSTISKWLLFVSAVPIAILVNVIRLTVTALLAKNIGPGAAEGFLHNLSGLLIFILSLIIIYGLYLIVRKIEMRYRPNRT